MSLHCLTLFHMLQVFLNSMPQIPSFLRQRKAGHNIKTRLWHFHAVPCTCLGGSSHILGIIILVIITLIKSLHQTNYISVRQVPQSQLQISGKCQILPSGKLNRNGNCSTLTKEHTRIPKNPDHSHTYKS